MEKITIDGCREISEICYSAIYKGIKKSEKTIIFSFISELNVRLRSKCRIYISLLTKYHCDIHVFTMPRNKMTRLWIIGQ